METRVEILKDGTWQKLTLGRNRNIKYNALINRIGKVDSREIGHTNTFSIPSVHNNIKVLGLNIFNPIKLAQALNSKYSAKYYVEDKILQIGFVVINNTTDGNININFIDESLEITEKWGSTTYQELLRDKILPIPQDYKDAIEELETYVLDKTILAPALSEVGTRGYNLALFPNNLNIIGENFQINIDEVRPDDVFNPYQCRPIFNAKSLFDIGTTAYGYTPIFDDSVDWSVVDRTYIVNSGLNKSAKGDNGIVSVTYSSIASNTPYFNRYDNYLNTWQTKTVFKYRADNAVIPTSLDNWTDPGTLMSAPVYTNFGTLIFPPGPWKDKNSYSIFRPNEESLTVGTLHFTADTGGMIVPSGFNNTVIIKGVWKSATAGGSPLVIDMNPFGTTIPEITINDGNDPAFSNVDVIVDKALFITTPPGAGDFVGIIVSVEGSFLPNSFQVNLGTMQVSETYLPAGVVAYDEYGQFLPESIDMTYAAPTKTVKSLLSAIMHKEGILMNINNHDREIKFFSYGKYYTQRDSGNFYDWSKYLQRYSPFKYNTDYGNNYAVKNRIGLSSPYPGNTSDIILDNQGSNTKYKDFTTNYVKVFKDITNVVKINNTNTPYFEFTHPGLGLVEYVGNLGTLEQQRFDKTSQGNFSGLSEIANVNYAIIPEGVREWYELVDGSIRATVEFLLPTEVIRTLDLSKPVYIEELNGFYIIEEVAEYVDSTTPVNVKLIKLVEDSNAVADVDPDPVDPTGPNTDPEIVLNTVEGYPNPPFSFVWSLVNYSTFNNYIPNSATIVAKKLVNFVPGTIFNGFVPTFDGYTGFEFSSAVTVPPYINSVVTFAAPIGSVAEWGWYEVQTIDGDDPSLVSNLEYAYLGDNTVPPTPPVINITKTAGIGDIVNTVANINISYDSSFTPTNPKVYVQRVITGTSLPSGSPIITNISVNDSSASVSLPSPAGSFNVTVRSDGETSNTLSWTRIL